MYLVLLRCLFVLEEHIPCCVDVDTGVERPVAQANESIYECSSVEGSKEDNSQVLTLMILHHREILRCLRRIRAS